jgi:histidyl-tRNA synthetase
MVENMISESNLESLQTLKAVIRAEEDINVSVDDALKRVLDFYKKFVPYQ